MGDRMGKSAASPPSAMSNSFSLLSASLLALCFAITLYNSRQLNDFTLQLQALKEELWNNKSFESAEQTVAKEESSQEFRVALLDGHGQNPEQTYMKHIFEAFRNFGYEVIRRDPTKRDWDVLWTHEFPFSQSSPYRAMIEGATWPQMVNHIPGSGYYSSKVELARAELSTGMPMAFRLPSEADALKAYASKHPDVLWVQKDNGHRNIYIKKIEDIDVKQEKSFVQKFIDNPLLIDNRKFDIGIYTVVTSVDPLRVYTFSADTIIRFCPKDYHPFNADDVEKYVVGDDYTPIWEIPSLKRLYNNHRFSFRDTLDEFLRSQQKDPETIWQQIQRIIAEVFQSQQQKMISARPPSDMDPKFFELSRFDFIVDESLNVFLMEANMSPNLSSGHFQQNQLLYEQVLMSVFSLVGIANSLSKSAEWQFRQRPRSSFPPASERDLRVPLSFCRQGGECEADCSAREECALCGECLALDESLSDVLGELVREHLSRRSMKRVALFDNETFKPLTRLDRLQKIWLSAKCESDASWC